MLGSVQLPAKGTTVGLREVQPLGLLLVEQERLAAAAMMALLLERMLGSVQLPAKGTTVGLREVQLLGLLLVEQEQLAAAAMMALLLEGRSAALVMAATPTRPMTAATSIGPSRPSTTTAS